MLTVRSSFADVDAWWEPFTLGIGPAGDHVRGLDAPHVAELRERCASLLPAAGPIEVTASAWVAVGRAG